MKTVKIIYFLISLVLLMTEITAPIMTTLFYYGFVLINLYISVRLLNKLEQYEQGR